MDISTNNNTTSINIMPLWLEPNIGMREFIAPCIKIAIIKYFILLFSWKPFQTTTLSPMWRIIAKNLSIMPTVKISTGYVKRAGPINITASVKPWPSPNKIASNIFVFAGFRRNFLNINLKPSSKTPAENAIKIPINKGLVA